MMMMVRLSRRGLPAVISLVTLTFTLILIALPLSANALASDWWFAPRRLTSQSQKLLPTGNGLVPSAFSCDLPAPLDPGTDGLPSAFDIFSGNGAVMKQVERLQALVKIPSFSYDDTEPESDPRWNIFHQIHDALEALYPNVHARMNKHIVNSFGLVFDLQGTDASLKPFMLTGHQDVVLVPDPSLWKYPPFSGHYDGDRVWGRGSSDDKNSITAIFSVLEFLLSDVSWNPRRTIIVALGFDEESSGRRGAGTIAVFLEQKYGPESMVMILDEGGMGLDLVEENTLYALPSVMEKGHLNVYIDLTAKGGHSSAPPPHTGVGIMAEVVTALEESAAQAYEPKLFRGSPVHNHLICLARYSPDASPKLTHLVHKDNVDALAKELVAIDRATQYRIQTSQAVTLISGGAKINALPEAIQVGINYRVAVQDPISKIKHNVIEVLQPIVTKYNLTLRTSEDDTDDGYETDVMTVTYDQENEVSPVSPTSGPVWDIFSGTIQHTFAFNNGRVVPVGESMTGSTDTRHYLNLAQNIYRWAPTRKGWNQNIHAIDEAIRMHAHMEAARFYYDLVRNMDASNA